MLDDMNVDNLYMLLDPYRDRWVLFYIYDIFSNLIETHSIVDHY